MAPKTKTVTGLEVTNSQVKLVEMAGSAHGVKITNFAVLDYPADLRDDAATAESIKYDIKSATRNTKEIFGVVSSPLVEHRILLLPPMTEQEMDVVTRREAGKGNETALKDVSFGYDVVGQTGTGDVKKSAVLIITTPNEVVKEQIRTMGDLGVCPGGLTTVPLALYHALLQGYSCGEEDTIAFINVGTKNACIIMVSNDSLLFSREFPLTSGPESTVASHSQRLTAEVKRSLLYFKQRYRGKVVSKGVLGGELQTRDTPSGTGLGDLAETLSKELGIGVEVFGVTDKLEVSLPQEKASEFHDILPSLTIPVGIAIAGLRQSSVNLMSQEGIQGKGLWGTGTVLKIASGILLLMLLGSYTWVSITNFLTGRTKLDTLNALESLSPELEEISTTLTERREHEARLLLLERLDKPCPPETGWSELLREISWLVTDDVVFNSLDAKFVHGRGHGITIEIMAPTKNKFNEFLARLQKASTLSVLSSRPGVQESQVDSRGNQSGLPYRFVIECEKRK